MEVLAHPAAAVSDDPVLGAAIARSSAAIGKALGAGTQECRRCATVASLVPLRLGLPLRIDLEPRRIRLHAECDAGWLRVQIDAARELPCAVWAGRVDGGGGEGRWHLDLAGARWRRSRWLGLDWAADPSLSRMAGALAVADRPHLAAAMELADPAVDLLRRASVLVTAACPERGLLVVRSVAGPAHARIAAAQIEYRDPADPLWLGAEPPDNLGAGAAYAMLRAERAGREALLACAAAAPGEAGVSVTLVVHGGDAVCVSGAPTDLADTGAVARTWSPIVAPGASAHERMRAAGQAARVAGALRHGV